MILISAPPEHHPLQEGLRLLGGEEEDVIEFLRSIIHYKKD